MTCSSCAALQRELDAAEKRGKLSGQTAALGALHNALYPRISEPDKTKIIGKVVALVEAAESRAATAERELARLKARKFPVLMGHDSKELRAYGCPAVVPWDFIADNARMCEQNHGQTPERLAERGGLAPCEMCAVVEGRRWFQMTNEESAKRLLQLLAAYHAQQPPTQPASVADGGKETGHVR